MKASREFYQGIEKLITQARREEAAATAKKARSNKTEKVPAFKFPKGRHVKHFNMDDK